MTKAELITAIAEKTEMSKKDTDKFLTAAISVVTDALASGDKIQLVGFGTFETRVHKARKGVNPRNPDETIDIPETTVPAFKPGRALKDAVAK